MFNHEQRRLPLITIALAISSTAGCRQIVGFDDPPATAAPDGGAYVSSSTAFRYADPVCGACVDRSCRAEARACAADPPCAAFAACLAACSSGDTECAASCDGRGPNTEEGQERWDLSHCEANACKDACRLWVAVDGKSCGSRIGATACAACCCDEYAACDDDPECLRFAACRLQCGSVHDSTCQEDCTGQPPPWNARLDDMERCRAGRCASLCQAQDWSCLGKVAWPKPSPSPANMYLSLADYVGGAPLADVAVKECRVADTACAAASASGGTDSAGFVKLPLIKSVFTGAVESYFDITKAGYPPYLLFLPESWFAYSFNVHYQLITRQLQEASVGALDPSLGGVIFLLGSCNAFGNTVGALASDNHGVRVVVAPRTPSTRIYYIIGGTPDMTATATDKSGLGAIVDLPPGRVTIDTDREATGEHIGSITVLIREDSITGVIAVPSP